MHPIDLEQCFSDSPQIRLQILRAEEYLCDIEARAKVLSKAARASIEASAGTPPPFHTEPAHM